MSSGHGRDRRVRREGRAEWGGNIRVKQPKHAENQVEKLGTQAGHKQNEMGNGSNLGSGGWGSGGESEGESNQEKKDGVEAMVARNQLASAQTRRHLLIDAAQVLQPFFASSHLQSHVSCLRAACPLPQSLSAQYQVRLRAPWSPSCRQQWWMTWSCCCCCDLAEPFPRHWRKAAAKKARCQAGPVEATQERSRTCLAGHLRNPSPATQF